MERMNEKGQLDARDRGALTVEQVRDLCNAIIKNGHGHYLAVFTDRAGNYNPLCLGASSGCAADWERDLVKLSPYWGATFVNYDEVEYFD